MACRLAATGTINQTMHVWFGLPHSMAAGFPEGASERQFSWGCMAPSVVALEGMWHHSHHSLLVESKSKASPHLRGASRLYFLMQRRQGHIAEEQAR